MSPRKKYDSITAEADALRTKPDEDVFYFGVILAIKALAAIANELHEVDVNLSILTQTIKNK